MLSEYHTCCLFVNNTVVNVFSCYTLCWHSGILQHTWAYSKAPKPTSKTLKLTSSCVRRSFRRMIVAIGRVRGTLPGTLGSLSEKQDETQEQ